MNTIKRMSNNDRNIPNNDENMNNNNNDQNVIAMTTHMDGIQLPKDAIITRKRKISSMSKPKNIKRNIKKGYVKFKEKTYYQFNKKMNSNEIYSSPIRFNYVSQEIFYDACGISVSWTNIVDHYKIEYVMKKMFKRSKARK